MTVPLQLSVRSFHLEFRLLIKATLLALLFMPKSTDGETRSKYKFISFRRNETDLWTLKGSYNNHRITVNAGAPSARIMEIMGPFRTIHFKYLCHVNYLDFNDRPNKVTFFVGDDDHTVDKSGNISKKEIDGLKGTFYFNNNSAGRNWMEIELDMPNDDEAHVENVIRCEVHNRQGSLKSHPVEIRDFRKILEAQHSGELHVQIHKIDQMTNHSLPCFPGGYPQGLNSLSHKLQFEWDFVKKWNSSRVNVSDGSELWPHWFDDDGTFHWEYIPEMMKRKMRKFEGYYQCAIGNHIHAYHKLTIGDQTSDVREQKFALHMSEVNLNVTDVDSSHFYLPLTIKGVTKNTVYTWKHGADQVERSSKNSQLSANLSHCVWSPYSVVPRCFGPFNEIYTIVMTAKNEPEELKVTYSIKPTRVTMSDKKDMPTISNDTPSHVYGVAGREILFTCKLKVNDEEMGVSLRGESENLIDLKKTNVPVTLDHDYDKAPMNPVKVTFTRITKNELNIEINGIAYSENRSSSFYLTCGTSGGNLVHQVMMSALPRPSFEEFKIKIDGKYAIITAFTPDTLKKWHRHGVDTTCLWEFDGIPLYNFYTKFRWKGSPNHCIVRLRHSILESYEKLAVYFLLENLSVDENHRNRCIFVLKKEFLTGYDSVSAQANRKKYKIRHRC